MGCYCSATPHPPCSYCENSIDYCQECEELHEDCVCNKVDEYEEQPIFDSDPPTIKERKEQENTKVRIKNTRNELRKTLGQ